MTSRGHIPGVDSDLASPDLSGGKPWTNGAPVRSTQVSLPPGMVNFGIGQPDFNLLPLDLMRRAAEHRLAQGIPICSTMAPSKGDGLFPPGAGEFPVRTRRSMPNACSSPAKPRKRWT